MLVKWAIGGAIIGAIVGVITDTGLGPGAVFGGICGVLFRKWIFRTFWT